MYTRLKECKNFGEIYQVIGESGCAAVSGILLAMFCVSPLLAGIVNAVMLRNIYTYNAYEYNYRFMMISNTFLALIALFWVMYIIGKIQYNKWYVEDMILRLKKRETWLLFWVALLVWGFITCLTSANFKGAFLGATELESGYLSHIYAICVMGCAYLTTSKERKYLLKIYAIVSNMLALIMLGFRYNIPVLRWFTAAEGCSVFTNSNHFGYYLAVSSLFFAGMFILETSTETGKRNIKDGVIFLVSFIIGTWALMINDTLGAFFGVLFGLIAFMLFWRFGTGSLSVWGWLPLILLALFTWLSFIGVITSSLGSTIGPSLVVFVQDIFKVAERSQGYEQAGTNRIALWKETWAAILQSPIVGYGPDIMYDRWYQPVISLTPHNEYLECAFFMGIPALIMYLGGLITLFVNRLKRLRKMPLFALVSAGAVFAYLVSAFFGVRKYHTAPYLFMFLGFIILKKDEERKQSD